MQQQYDDNDAAPLTSVTSMETMSIQLFQVMQSIYNATKQEIEKFHADRLKKEVEIRAPSNKMESSIQGQGKTKYPIPFHLRSLFPTKMMTKMRVPTMMVTLPAATDTIHFVVLDTMWT
jgi:hypothetical protein